MTYEMSPNSTTTKNTLYIHVYNCRFSFSEQYYEKQILSYGVYFILIDLVSLYIYFSSPTLFISKDISFVVFFREREKCFDNDI